MKPLTKKQKPIDKKSIEKYVKDNRDMFTELVPNILYVETSLNNYLKAISPSLYDKYLRFALSTNEIAVFDFNIVSDTTAKINYLHLDGLPIESMKNETVYYNGRIKQFKAIVYEALFISNSGFHETKFLFESKKLEGINNYEK